MMAQHLCNSQHLKMGALVSGVMPHITVTKAGKEVAGILLCYLGRKSFPKTLQQNSPQISQARTAYSQFSHWQKAIGQYYCGWLRPPCFSPWDQVFTALTNQRVILARKKGQCLCLPHIVSSCLSLARKKCSETFKDHYTSFATIKNCDAVEIFHVLCIDFKNVLLFSHRNDS